MKRIIIIAILALCVVALPGIGMAQSLTFNTATTCSQVTLSNSNLTAAETGGSFNYFAPINASIPSGSKVYFEVVMGAGYNNGGGNGIVIGVFDQNLSWACGNLTYPGINTNGIGYNAPGTVIFNNAFVNTWAAYSTNGSVVSIAIDTVNNKLWARVNGGNWNNDILANQNPATNTGGQSISSLAGFTLTPVVDFRNGGGGTVTGQFSASSWSFSAPSGFNQLVALPPLPTPPNPLAIKGGSKGIKGTSGNSIGCSSPTSTCSGGIRLNFITDVGATCNGVVDDGPALMQAGVKLRAIQAANPGSTATLIIPPGSNCQLKTCPASQDLNSTALFDKINAFTIIATGATITASGAGNCVVYTGTINLTFADAFNPNAVGDTCVTMTTPGNEAQFPVGRWLILAGQGMQVNSFPPNYANWEYAQVASTPSGKVCFTAPLKNSYPNDSRAGVDLTGLNCGGAYCGGPGKLALMDSNWGSYLHMIGGTWDTSASSGGSITWGLRTVIFDNVTWNSPNPLASNQCWYPSFDGTVTYNNVNFPNCNVEVDKEIDAMVVNGGFIKNLQFQSQSVNSITLNNAATTSLNGLPLKTVCNNSTLTGLAVGNTLGSTPETFVGVNCKFTDPGPTAFNGFTITAPWSYSSGTFSLANADVCGSDLPQFNVTGGRMKMIFSGIGNADNVFTITGSSVPIVGPPPNCNQTFSMTTTLPNASLPPPAPGTTVSWSVDQAIDFSCSGCFGSGTPMIGRTAFDLNFSAAQHKPINTYLNRTYTCANNIPNPNPNNWFDINTEDDFTIAGTFNSAVVNVMTADTNPSDSAPILITGPGTYFNLSTGATTFTLQFANVDLKHAGTRTVLPASSSGAQGNDILTPPTFGTNSWMTANSYAAVIGNNGSTITNGPAGQCPVVNVIWQTTR